MLTSRQFETILSKNKTMENHEMKTTKYLTQAAIIAALYVCLCLLQNLLLPNYASMAVQFRAAEAL